MGCGSYISPYEASEFAPANLCPVHPNSTLCGIYQVIFIRNSFNEHSDIQAFIQTFFHSWIHPNSQLLPFWVYPNVHASSVSVLFFPVNKLSRCPTRGHVIELRRYFERRSVDRGVRGRVRMSEWMGECLGERVNEAVGGWRIHWK